MLVRCLMVPVVSWGWVVWLALGGVGCESSEDVASAPQDGQPSGMMPDDGSSPPGAGAGASEDPETAGSGGDPDYAMPANWLCRPGNNAACQEGLDTTVIEADGSMTVERFEPHPDPPIDCFYVYPTVSLDETPNSDLVPGMEERAVVQAQFARFASQCRLFAPMYRQVSLTALRASLSGGGSAQMPDRMLGLRDVSAAWEHYLANDNDGRGVVLVGHSQGSSVLTQLIKSKLDAEELDARFLGALLIGTNIEVPEGAVVGGTFENVPLCRADDELGCIVTYASFREDVPPPAGALFGNGACTNPAALGGGNGALEAYLSAAGPGVSSDPMGPWVEGGEQVETAFVRVPGLLSAECVSGERGDYLAVTTASDPSDPRADAITGDVVSDGEVNAGWGLHLIDVHLAIGNLLNMVQAKAEAHAGSGG